MASWKARAHTAGPTDPPASDRAAVVLGEVLNVVKGIDPAYRAAVSKRFFLVPRFQRWFLNARLSLCTRLADALDFDKVAANEWLQLPASSSWNFDVSCIGARSHKGLRRKSEV